MSVSLASTCISQAKQLHSFFHACHFSTNIEVKSDDDKVEKKSALDNVRSFSEILVIGSVTIDSGIQNNK